MEKRKREFNNCGSTHVAQMDYCHLRVFGAKNEKNTGRAGGMKELRHMNILCYTLKVG